MLAAAVLMTIACGGVEPDGPHGPITGHAGSEGPGGPHHMTAAGADSASSSSGGETTAADETAGCQPGHEGCACLMGNGCTEGLTCLSNICVDAGPVCTPGSEGCPCTDGGTCNPMLVCLSDLCVDPDGG